MIQIRLQSFGMSRWKRNVTGALLASVIIGISIVLLAGCTTTIVLPPAELVESDPVDVYVADYGRHASLILPHEDANTMIEYGYGEWDWFALNRTGFFGAIRAMLFPTQGTLCRRYVTGPFDEPSLRRQLHFESLYTLRVNRGDAVRLRDVLTDRYEANIETQVYNERYDFYFVKDEERYTFFNNCNPVLARWLTELGCDVRGPALLSNWRVRAPEP